MPIIRAIKVATALIFFVLGVAAMGQMLQAELSTGEDFTYYFKWAAAAGLVFLSVGAALTAYERDDSVMTQFEEDK
jgi:Na+/H+-dicarboxylate symporter